MNLTDLEKSIVKTIAFFDIFDYPLTLIEIYKWLYQPKGDFQLSDVSQAVESESLKNILANKNGFYFLSNRQDLVKTRLDRYQIGEKKFKIALKTVFWLRWLAFIKLIAICNNANYNNATKQSDIDFFIIVKRGRLWWSRLVITLATSLLGVRRHGKKIADRVCLSFYITDEHPNLADIALKPIDTYLVYWLATLAPIYDLGISREFFAANGWLNDYLPNFYRPILNYRRSVSDNSLIKFSKGFDGLILGSLAGDWLEKFARFIQLKKMKQNISETAGLKDTNVVISDSMLKFHENDRRREYQDLWERKVSALGI